MTMMDFLRRSEGTWFSQRTVHHFDAVADESGESNLIVQVLEKDDPRVQAVCEQQAIEAQSALGGAAFSWRDNLDDEDERASRAAVLVDLPDAHNPRTGKLLRNQGYVEQMPVISRYFFAEDGVLTIDTEYTNNQGQERCWFVTDYFRVRIGTVRLMSGVNLISYSSERRCLTPEAILKLQQRAAEPA
ncbi:spermidine synthase [Gloeobacter kilaueensis JS1]|uniref:Chromophore lyase CpcS/CpeS n=2 Tax=Gloeobacter TaxID=33071 RepID=U5QS65_GLOK1|nr:spermidine synthase [Gloeobacter kilaueensis JS1]